jgi:hypothetical protein
MPQFPSVKLSSAKPSFVVVIVVLCLLLKSRDATECNADAAPHRFNFILLMLDKQERKFQCYLCRAVNINYPHFCQYIILYYYILISIKRIHILFRHLRVPGQKNCRQCKKQCLLWQPAEEVDNRALSVVHQEAKESGIVITEAPI